MKHASGSPEGVARPRALFVTPEAPFPMMGGGALRSASLLMWLACRYTVDVIAFREPGAPDPSGAIPAGLVHDTLVIDLPANARHRPAKFARNAVRLARRVPPLVDRFSGFGDMVSRWLRGREYKIAVVEHFWCAPYLDQIEPLAARTVVDLHNIESVLHARCAAAERGPLAVAHRIFERACRSRELRWLPRFSLLLAVSEADAHTLRSIVPGCNITVYPNTLPETPVPRTSEEHVIVFSGNLEYHPNVSAVRFFRREIWPQLRERWPDLVWRLVGRNPDAVRKFTLGDPRIQISGAVEDAVAEIARAQVVVVPLLAGSGTRLKIIEAWAAARAVVSTTIGAEGLPARDGENIILADDSRQFVEAVSNLLSSADLRAKLGYAGRCLFEAELTWPAAWKNFTL